MHIAACISVAHWHRLSTFIFSSRGNNVDDDWSDVETLSEEEELPALPEPIQSQSRPRSNAVDDGCAQTSSFSNNVLARLPTSVCLPPGFLLPISCSKHSIRPRHLLLIKEQTTAVEVAQVHTSSLTSRFVLATIRGLFGDLAAAQQSLYYACFMLHRIAGLWKDIGATVRLGLKF